MKNRTFGILSIVLLAIYIASPMDLVSDFIPVAGVLDDAVALLLLCKQVVAVFNPAIE